MKLTNIYIVLVYIIRSKERNNEKLWTHMRTHMRAPSYLSLTSMLWASNITSDFNRPNGMRSVFTLTVFSTAFSIGTLV